MGLLDQVLGKFSDSQQSATPASMSSMSPMVKGLLLLLATKAYHDYTTRRAGQSAASLPSSGSLTRPAGVPVGGGAGSGGGRGGLLGGLGGGSLGGLLAGLGGWGHRRAC